MQGVPARSPQRRCDPEPGSNARHLILLQNTPFYPEGGGQPSDTGVLRTHNSRETVEVLDVRRQPDGSVVHVAAAPLPPGTAVAAEVDWRRRFDLMQQHTGQHLLSAVCDEVTGADTVSWELHAPKGLDDDVAIDLAIPSVSSEQLQAIEERCNALIRAGCSVRPVVLDNAGREVLMNSPILRGALPPGDPVKGPTRVVEIDGVDINACGGTHLRSLAELQVIKLLGQEKAKGMVRLRFQVGGRVLATLGRMLTVEAGLNKALGCGPADWAANVAKLQGERRELSKRCTALQEEAAGVAGAQLASDALSPGGGGVPHYHRDDANGTFLMAVAAAAVTAGASGALLLLTGGLKLHRRTSTSSRKKPAAEGYFVLAGPADAVAQMGPKVAELLGAGKGGGRPGLFQGKVPSFDGLEAAKALLSAALPQGQQGSRGSNQTLLERRRAAADAAFAAGGDDAVAEARSVLVANAAEAERQLRSFDLGESPLLRPATGDSGRASHDQVPIVMWAEGGGGMPFSAAPVCGALVRSSFEDNRGLPLPLWPAGSMGLEPAPLVESMLRPSSAAAGPNAQPLPLWPAGSTSAFPPLSVDMLRASIDRMQSQELPIWTGNAAIVSPPSLPGH